MSAVKKADVVETIDKCRDPEFAHLLMFDIVAHRDIGRWNGIVEGEVRLAESMWQAVGAMPEIRFVQQNIDENGGVSNTLFMFRRDGGIKEEPFVIPVPGSQWIVTQVQSVRRAEE
ncbi:hypothetical protein [Planctellipticum variicoloris]|uniref:hypothetical protein n=1 Tax=Planctellipticum variicoloris TaxID=3064265 RepID=UPI0030137B45|nr:hypothetical protein SH412_001064 [Planctomycetaceae bacterium SH412]